ncbi:TonB family protein [uncultured Oxalicibacterium sp.]|uniref:TonB family protein n=1 Tax=uncultured Oxalicibacterium sp. TaxID=1168540 RepID=UPI0025F15B4D|nr:TonB family protein [uncultured Oxalicibacterium sp.]
MKLFAKNRTLSIAIAISVVVHAVLLTVRFVAPEAFKFQPTDPGLEVILVNAKHDRAPLKADALAQANLDGGGNADAGRAKSPLPDMRRTADGDSTKTSRRKIEDLERQQQQLLAQMQSKQSHRTQKSTDAEPNKAAPQPTAAELIDNARALLRREAEIARSIEDYNKRPKKTQVTPSTREVGYAAYYKTLQDRIERIGTLNFPQKDGRKLYGEMTVYIPIYQDGTLYMKEGGPRIERSSGNRALDEAALAIVRRAAPFGRFPDNMRSTNHDDVWEIITRFNFTRDDALQTETRGN